MNSLVILCKYFKPSQCLFSCVIHSVVLHMHVVQQMSKYKLFMLHSFFKSISIE